MTRPLADDPADHNPAVTPADNPAGLRARPIGMFDSGIGGLTVLHECLVAMPAEDFVYVGDTAAFRTAPRPRTISSSRKRSPISSTSAMSS